MPSRQGVQAAVAMAAALACIACSHRPAVAVEPVPAAIVLDCADNASRPIAAGELLNNMWNKRSAGSGPWRQCLRSRERSGRTEYGWSWEWPGRDGLYAYPEILVGRSPWRGLPSYDPRFPRRIGDTGSMWIDYDVESEFRGKRNLALEFWLTDAASAASPGWQHGTSAPTSIKAELMIWSEASDGMVSKSDKPLAVVEIDGRSWAVHVQRDWGDASGAASHKWLFITYRALQPASTIRYDARKFFQDAISRGLLDERDVIEGVELGNEIVSGSGSTWIRRFDIAVD